MGVETELLGIKNRYDGKEFRVIEREDGTIAVLAGDKVLVDSGVLPVTATPSGLGVDLVNPQDGTPLTPEDLGWDVGGGGGNTSPGFTYLSGVSLLERGAGEPVVIASNTGDGYVYGTTYGTQYRSADGGRTWESIGALVTTDVVVGIHAAGDGEMLIQGSQNLFKTTNWGRAGTTARVVLNSPGTAQFQPWGVDVAPEVGRCIATHYSSVNFLDSRYVWHSADYGNTWSVVRDVNSLPNGTTRHIHAVRFDRWNNYRMYYNDHETGTNRTMYYSDDSGATWSSVDITYRREDGVIDMAQPTVMVDTPAGIVMGDDDAWSGTFILPRGKNSLRVFVKGPDMAGNVAGPKSFATYGYYDSAAGIGYMCWNQQLADGLGYLMAFDGITGDIIYRERTSYPITGMTGVGGGPGLAVFALTDTEIVAKLRKPSTADNTVQANWHFWSAKPSRGKNYDPENLPVLRGAKYNVESPAIWHLAEANGYESISVGYKAKAQGSKSTVYGNQASATQNNTMALGSYASVNAISGTVVGVLASATGSYSCVFGSEATSAYAGCVVVGYKATSAAANATAIGQEASAAGSGTAIGFKASVTTRGVAIGNQAKTSAGSVDGIAIGDGVTVGSWSISLGIGTTTVDGGIAMGRTAIARDGISIGYQATQVGSISKCVLLGRSTSVSASNGTAIGDSSVVAVGHTDAVALGQGSTTQRSASVAVGPRDIESTGAGKGLILRSPNGTAYRITVSDAGVISTTAV